MFILDYRRLHYLLWNEKRIRIVVVGVYLLRINYVNCLSAAVRRKRYSALLLVLQCGTTTCQWSRSPRLAS